MTAKRYFKRIWGEEDTMMESVTVQLDGEDFEITENGEFKSKKRITRKDIARSILADCTPNRRPKNLVDMGLLLGFCNAPPKPDPRLNRINKWG